MKKPKLRTLKKKLWKIFSEYIRKRDCLKTTGCKDWGLCHTCGKRYHFKLLQAGHFVPGRHNAGLYDEQGVLAQCYNCNINLRGNLLVFRRRIISLYGEGYDEVLENRAKQVKKFTPQELIEMIEQYKQKIKSL